MRLRFAPLLLALPALLAAPACKAQAPDPKTPQLDSPAPKSAAHWIREGRQRLDERRPELAEPCFQKAFDLDPTDFESKLWLIRSWMDQGRSNDSLDAIDELRRAGHSGPRMEYLYGMAFLRRAQGQLSSGVMDTSPRMNFEDAAFRLGKALEAFPTQYPDAYQGVAISAWYCQDLERARWAGEMAVQLDPTNARACLQLGRIAMSQFSAERSAQEGPEWTPEMRATQQRALEVFRLAIEALGQPLDDPNGQRLLSDSGIQLGHAEAWGGRLDEALQAYALGIAWSPEAVDYRQLQNVLGTGPSTGAFAGRFHRALEAGARRFQSNFGQGDPRDANLLWWLGWERLGAGHGVGSELAFLASARKNPSFINAWFYAALARFEAGNFAGGADLLSEGWQRDSNIMVDSVLADKDTHLWILKQALGRLVAGQRFANAETNRRAAILARLIAESDPYEGWNWNNLGMFVRDQADALIHEGTREASSEPVHELYETSYGAYERSLALLPEDPGVINDTAVLLHYYLKRESTQALEMYAKAAELATKALEDEELDDWERNRLETALRDAKENRRLLLEAIAEQEAPPALVPAGVE